LLGGYADDIEPQSLSASFVHSEDRLRGVVERESFRRHESKTKPRMQEPSPAREAFAWVLAVNHAVDAAEVVGAIAFAAAGRGKRPRIFLGIAHALRRCRMRGQEFSRPAVDLRSRPRPQLRIALHGGEEAHRPIGIVPGPRRDADSDAVGL